MYTCMINEKIIKTVYTTHILFIISTNAHPPKEVVNGCAERWTSSYKPKEVYIGAVSGSRVLYPNFLLDS